MPNGLPSLPTGGAFFRDDHEITRVHLRQFYPSIAERAADLIPPARF
jgi:hypothetical protein